MRDIKKCYFCNSSTYELLSSQESKDPYWGLINKGIPNIPMHWVKCSICGLVWRTEQLSPEETIVLYQKYRDIILGKETAEGYFDRITSIPDNESENYQRVSVFMDFIESYISCSKLNHLDIGTGAGVFIHTFRRLCHGWNSFAVEATPEFAEVARQKLGIHVDQGFYRPGLFHVKFALITILQVLEHCQDPLATLSDIKEDLDEKGIVIIEVPSHENVGYLPFDHDVYSIPHIYLFSENDLKYMIEKVGMRVLELKSFKQHARKTYQVRAVARL